MLCKTLNIQMTNSYLLITHDEQYYTWLIDMDVIQYLLSKGYYCSLWGGLRPGQEHKVSALALYFSNNNAITSHCSITVNNITKTVYIYLHSLVWSWICLEIMWFVVVQMLCLFGWHKYFGTTCFWIQYGRKMMSWMLPSGRVKN